MTHYQLANRYLLAILIAFATLAALIVYTGTNAHAAGNPPGTTCTGYRYGKGGGKTCIRWVYPTTTTTAP